MSLKIKLEGENEARQKVQANVSPRYIALNTLEAYVNTRQYDGRPDWFTGGPNAKPLLERKPCVAYPIVRTAITSNVDLLLGEGRFPTITLDQAEESDEADDGGVSKEDAEALEKALINIYRQCRFRKVCRGAFKQAQGVGTAVAILGVRSNRLFIETVKAKWSTPTFTPDREAVTSLEVRYPYIAKVRQQDGTWAAKARLFRRVIDDKRDVTYLPADAEEDGREPEWKEDPARSRDHGLGFCPVVWYAHMLEETTEGTIDGNAIHADDFDEIFAHDVALSQRHRAALFAGDPQWTETGIGDDEPVGRVGRDAIPSTPGGGNPGQDNPVTGVYTDPGAPTAPARMKSPGEVWRSPNKDAKFTMHTLPGDALKAIDENARDLRTKLAESMSVVFMDPESIKFAATLSGKAMMSLKARQLDRLDQEREDVFDGFMEPVTWMLLRIAKAKPPARLRGIKRLVPLLEKLGDEAPLMTPDWGDYFKPDPSENKSIVEGAAMAVEKKLSPRRNGIELIQRMMGIRDVDQAIKDIDDEAAEREAQAVEHAGAMAKVSGPSEPSAILGSRA